MCPYLDGRAEIVPITNAQGTLTHGYIQFNGQIVSQDPFYHWTEHGKRPYKELWNSPAGPITANTQVKEKIQDRADLAFREILPIFNDYTTLISIANNIPDIRRSHPALISEQIISEIFPKTNQPRTGTRVEIIKPLGEADVIKPNPFENPHGGTPIITTMYKEPQGRGQAFQQQADTTWKPIRFGGTSQGDKNLGGSSVAGMKKRGLL